MKQRLRLVNAYEAGWPLPDGPPERELPADLAGRLRAWQEHFAANFHYERGWRTADDAAAHACEGRLLQRLLTAEVGRWAHVELDLWPVPD